MTASNHATLSPSTKALCRDSESGALGSGRAIGGHGTDQTVRRAPSAPASPVPAAVCAQPTGTAARGAVGVSALRPPQAHAQTGIHPADRALAMAQAAMAGTSEDRWAVLRGPSSEVRDRTGREPHAGPLVVDRA